MSVHAVLAAVAALAVLAVVSCAWPRAARIQLSASSQPASAVSPASNASPDGGPAPSSSSASTAQTTQPATQPATQPTTATTPEHRCDAGAWAGRHDPNGAPSFAAGDAGAVYVWHDGAGWHLRATDARPPDHHYSGAIQLLPPVANVTSLRTVRDERDDRVWIEGTNTVDYDLHTYASVDGFDFTLSCRDAGRENEALAYRTLFDGQPAADRVRIGPQKTVPASADFAFHRTI
jgi:hypothetical protein